MNLLGKTVTRACAISILVVGVMLGVFIDVDASASEKHGERKSSVRAEEGRTILRAIEYLMDTLQQEQAKSEWERAAPKLQHIELSLVFVHQLTDMYRRSIKTSLTDQYTK